MIEIKNLYKNFDRQPVLRGINLKINTGESLAIIGASGKGKSVILKHMIGLIKPDRGQILLNDQDITQLRGRARQKAKANFGIVFQGGALFDSLTVFDNVAFPLVERTKLKSDEIRKRVRQELKNVGLEDADHKYPAEISGGMIKRVALARCLVMNPEVILFDEPTTGLDPLSTKAIHKLIRTLQTERNLTAVIVSHEIPEIFDLVDQVAMLYEGSIVAVGTPDEIRSSDNPTVKQFLHGDIDLN